MTAKRRATERPRYILAILPWEKIAARAAFAEIYDAAATWPFGAEYEPGFNMLGPNFDCQEYDGEPTLAAAMAWWKKAETEAARAARDRRAARRKGTRR